MCAWEVTAALVSGLHKQGLPGQCSFLPKTAVPRVIGLRALGVFPSPPWALTSCVLFLRLNDLSGNLACFQIE